MGDVYVLGAAGAQTVAPAPVNLLRGTRSPSGSAWRYIDLWTRDTTYNGLQVLRRAGAYYGFGTSVTLEPGMYTFGCYARASDQTSMLVMVDNAGQVAHQIQVPVSTSWSWVEAEINVTNNTVGYVRTQLNVEGVTLYVCGHCLQRGTAGSVLHSWTPNPEDFAAVWAALDAKISITADMPVDGPEIMDDYVGGVIPLSRYASERRWAA